MPSIGSPLRPLTGGAPRWRSLEECGRLMTPGVPLICRCCTGRATALVCSFRRPGPVLELEGAGQISSLTKPNEESKPRGPLRHANGSLSSHTAQPGRLRHAWATCEVRVTYASGNMRVTSKRRAQNRNSHKKLRHKSLFGVRITREIMLAKGARARSSKLKELSLHKWSRIVRRLTTI